MPSVTKTPGKITQVGSTSEYTSWTNTQNLHYDNNNAAKTNLITGIKGKNSRIKKIQATKFNFNLPEGAEITNIKVEYAYKKDCKVTNKYPDIAGPTIKIINSGIDSAYTSVDASAPGKSYPNKNWYRNWTGKYTEEVIVSGKSMDTSGIISTPEVKTKTMTFTYKLPTRSRVNSDNFGVEFSFPKNTSENEGYIDFRTLKITLDYKLPTYAVNVIPVESSTVIKDYPTKVSVRLDNKGLCSYAPTLRVAVPSNMTVNNISTSLQSFIQIATGLYEWKPYMNETVASATLDLELTPHSTGTNTITVTEQLTNTASSLNITVEAQGTGIEDETIDSNQIIYAMQDNDFTIPVKIPIGLIGATNSIYLHTTAAIKINNTPITANSYYTIPVSSLSDEGEITLTGLASSTGTINLGISFTTTPPENPTFVVKIIPDNFTVPRLAMLKLSDEESDRLGDGVNYTISSFLKIVCATSSISSFDDYFRTFRIGVVNSTNSTTKADIFNACKEWSEGLSVFNELEEKTVSFTYNEDYPVYIIFTGNYPDCQTCDLFSLNFTEPNLMETNRDDNSSFVIFPEPIKEIIKLDGEANLELPHNVTCNSLILYDLDLPDDFNEKNNLAIRGIGLRLDVSSEFAVICSAKLKSPTGISGERSVLLSNTTNQIMLGGSTDRWGFNVSELVDIANFEIELAFTDTFNESTENLNVNIRNVEAVIYYGFYENFVVDWFIEGENLAGYNVFLEDVTIPEGIKTNTKYLNVDGTDTNKAFRQNIKEKEITIEFSIDDCNIEESTATLQDIAEKIITERDELYRPIPKRVEFSHYPGLYWEYIMEDTIDAKVDGSHIDCTVKLTIPDGTAYTNEDIITGKSGRVSGLAKINPTIVFIPTSTHIEIEEEYSGQKFLMSYNEWTTQDTVEIDCKNRKITLIQSDGTTKDITAYADYNTSWFLLYDAFILNETGCIIQTVSWKERK